MTTKPCEHRYKTYETGEPEPDNCSYCGHSKTDPKCSCSTCKPELAREALRSSWQSMTPLGKNVWIWMVFFDMPNVTEENQRFTKDYVSDWHHWRNCEERILKDEDLAGRYAAECVYHFPHKISKTTDMVTLFMEKNIEQRAEALYIAYCQKYERS